MKNWRRQGWLGSLSLLLVLLLTAFEKADTIPFSTAQVAFLPAKGQAYFANKTAKNVKIFDTDNWKEIGEWKLDREVTGIALTKSHALVTSTYEQGFVNVFDLATQQLQHKIPVGMGATSPVLSPNGKTLYVCNQFANNVSVVDLGSFKEKAKIPAVREPFSADLSKDGRYLFVANFLPATRADLDTVTAVVTVIDTRKKKKIKDIALSNGSNALRTLKISPDGRFAFVVHNLGRHQVPTSQLEQGWMNTSALSVIDVKKQQYLATVLLDEPEYGAAGSWGIDFTDELIAVSHSGTHDVSFIQYNTFVEKLLKVENKETLAYNLQFLSGIRERRKVKGNGPRFISFWKGKLIAPTYFSDTLNFIDTKEPLQDTYLALNPDFKETEVRRGERLFNDARFCFQGWQSCNGCHPGEARTDGLNWDLLNDGIGNPKNVKSLVLSHKTPPAMISGIRADAEVAVRAGFRHIQFTTVREEYAKLVDSYLCSLKPLPSPYLEKGKLSKIALEGRKIFLEQNCNWCHSDEHYTDNEMHPIGEVEFKKGWNTPTLKEVWRTAPYLHDGRTATMQDLFKKDKHGLSRNLTKDEIEKLSIYVLSL
ncbi:MAG: hypothetical protein MI784_13340 [Cytophagales bacterium]|nr:hypothetical protein [Cytophagales bacterium]